MFVKKRVKLEKLVKKGNGAEPEGMNNENRSIIYTHIKRYLTLILLEKDYSLNWRTL